MTEQVDRIELTERPTLQGDLIRRFEILLGGTIYVLSVDESLKLARWIFELAAEHNLDDSLAEWLEQHFGKAG